MNTLRDYVNFKLTHADKVAEAEGYPLKMENCKKYKKMKQLEVYGNSVQDGTPTPDAPVEVVSVGEKIVNLFNPNTPKEQGFIHANGAVEPNGKYPYIYTYTFTVKPNTTYVFNTVIGSNYVWALYNKNIGFIQSFYHGAGIADLTFTTTSDTAYVKICTSKDEVDAGKVYLNEGITLIKDPHGKYKIPVVQRGINLFSMAKVNAESKTVSGLTFTPLDDERVYVKGTATANVYYYMYAKATKNMVLKSGRYKSKPFKKSEISILFNMRYMDGTGAGNLNSMHSGVTYNNDIYIESALIYVAKGTVMDDIIELQLMEGTENLPYEPYVEPVTTNIYLDEPLRKLGDYADYIDFKENKVVRKCVKKYLKDYDWLEYRTLTDSKGVHYDIYVKDNSIIPSMINQVNLWSPAIAKSNIFPIYATYEHDTIHFGIILWTWAMNVRVSFPQEYCADTSNVIASFKAWLNEYNPYMLRVLAEPTEEPISLNLPKLTAKTTIIEVDTSLAPSNAYGKYIKK